MTEQTDTTARGRLVLEVVRTHAENAIQVTLSQLDAKGTGWAYRLAGSKHYNLGATPLLEQEITERDAQEVRGMLDAAFPVTATPDAEKPKLWDLAEITPTPVEELAAVAHVQALVDRHALALPDRDALAGGLAVLRRCLESAIQEGPTHA